MLWLQLTHWSLHIITALLNFLHNSLRIIKIFWFWYFDSLQSSFKWCVIKCIKRQINRFIAKKWIKKIQNCKGFFKVFSSHSNTCRSTICLGKVTKMHSKPKQHQREPHGGNPKSLLACATVRRDDNGKHCHWSFALLSNSYLTESLFYQNKQTITREFQHQTWFFPEKGLWANRSGFYWPTERDILINLYAICILQGKTRN